jgi:PAS domain S-box-containing protein
MSTARHRSGVLTPDSPASWQQLATGNRLRYVITVLVVAALYFIAAKAGLSLASVHTNVSPVWPPAGIALAAVLLLGYRIWPAILLGAFFANFLTPVPVATSVVIAFGNTVEALSGGFVLRWLGFHESLDRAMDVFKFVVAAIFCTMISATIGNLALAVGHAARWADFDSLWVTWWLGDLTGALMLGPLLLTWGAGKHLWLPKRRYLEATVLLLLLSLSAIATFGKVSPAPLLYYPLTRLMLPFLLWAGFRLGRRGVTIAIVVVSVFAIWGTSHGTGPFISGTANGSLLVLQFYLASNALTFLFLSVVVEERHRLLAARRENERRLAANLAVTKVLAESPESGDALRRILPTVGEKLGWEFGCMWVPDAEGKLLRSVASWQAGEKAPRFEALTRERTFESGVGLPGRVWASRKPAWIRDVATDDNFPRAPIAIAEGLHAAFAFPILFNQKFLGVMEFFSHEIRQPDEAMLAMFAGIGSQIGQFMERQSGAEALRENEERLRLATQTGKVGVWDWDVVANRVSWTDSLYHIHGVTSEQFDGSVEGFASLVHPDDREVVSTALDKSLNTGAPYQLEFRTLRPDGEVVWLFTDAVVLRENGKPVRMVGATLDITDLNRAEKALRDSQARYRAVIEALPAAVYTTDAEGRITMFNQAAVELSGRVPTIGSDSWCVTWKLYYPDGTPMPHDECPMAMALKKGEAIRGFEAVAERPDGSRVSFVPFPTPLHDSNGKLIGAINMLVDITDRNSTEKVLRHFAAIVETSDDAIISKDLNGIITSWNPAATRLYGYTAEEVIGRPVSILIPPERPDEEPAILAKLRRGESIDHYETVRMGKDGRRLYVSLTVSPIRDAKGNVVGASKIARDITDQKQTQEEIARLLAAERAARYDAEVASRSKDEFLAMLSHELRTPLTAMLGWLSILREKKLDKKTSEHAIETIERNAKAQAQLIEDLVDISRIVGGKLNLEVGPTELLPVINAAVEVVRPAANAKNISIEVNYDSTVGPVLGDASRLQQVIWNLLANAVKFTPKDGSVYLDFRRAGSSAEVVIRDTGMGITPDFLPHVFERFRQAESPVIRSHRGVGLGLAIVRHLIELHGGTVQAESDGENRGATFTICLPLAVVRYTAASVNLVDEANGKDSNALNGLRILLVEDEPDARELLAVLLQGSGANVEAVDSAGDALQRLPLFIPDVLLSDIGLPRESGYDLIRQVRSLASDINKIPAIALTAFATESDRQMSLSAGFQAHLAKPVEPAHLVETIKVLVNGKS